MDNYIILPNSAVIPIPKSQSITAWNCPVCGKLLFKINKYYPDNVRDNFGLCEADYKFLVTKK